LTIKLYAILIKKVFEASTTFSQKDCISYRLSAFVNWIYERYV